MSAHSPSKSEEAGSPFWSFVNLVTTVALGGGALFWGAALFIGAIKESRKAPDAQKILEEKAAAEAAATPAAAAPAAPVAEAKKEAPAAPVAEAKKEAPAAMAPAAPAAAPAVEPKKEAPVAAATTAPAPAAPASDVAEITIKPDLANPLAYDVKEFSVKAGQKVKITFNNTHPTAPQLHNIVIGKPGAKDALFNAAMQMATAADGMAKGFVPSVPEVLFHTKLLQPNSTEVLEFTAPATVGDYPYMCTFPGHSFLMNGVMKVK